MSHRGLKLSFQSMKMVFSMAALAVLFSAEAVAQATLSTQTIGFGSQAVTQTTAAKSVVLKNDTAAPLNLAPPVLSGTGFASNAAGTTCPSTGVLAAASSCAYALTFTPPAAPSGLATFAGSLKINYTGGPAAQTVSLSGTGVLAYRLSTALIDFGATAQSETSVVKTVTLTNNQQTQVLGISKLAVTTAPYALDASTTCSLAGVAPNSSCVIAVTAHPTTLGAFPMSYVQLLTSQMAPHTNANAITLTGRSIIPVTVAPTSILNFTAPVGSTSAYQAITITNNKPWPLHITNLQLSGDYIQTASSCGASLPYVLAAAASCNVTVSFNPTVGGVRSGQLQFVDDAVTSPQVVNLSGTATSPLTLSGNQLTFNAQKLGTQSQPKMILLTNHEGQDENFSVAMTGDFSYVTNCPTGKILANSNCVLSVIFNPPTTETPGPVSGSMTVSSAAPGGGPLGVTLIGSATSQDPPADVLNVSPGAGQAGALVDVVITGNAWSHFSDQSVISFIDTDDPSYPADITVVGQSWSASDPLHLHATLLLASGPGTVYGARNIKVVTPLSGGATETAQLYQAFILADPTNAHVIDGVNPATIQQCATQSITVNATGTLFVPGVTIANFGDGVTVNWVQVNSANNATVNISVPCWTFTGPRTITLATGGEFAVSLPGALQITSDGATIDSLTPNVESQGWAGSLQLVGVGTHFVPDATVVTIGGGVIVGRVDVLDPTHATVHVAVPANATPGVQSVVVSTGGEIESAPSGFTVVNSTAALTGAFPAQGAQGQTLDVTISGNAFTNFVAGQVAVNFGDSVVPGWVPTTGFVMVNGTPAVIDAHTVKVNVTVSPYAGLGTLNAYLTSGPSDAATILPFTFTVTQSSARIVSVQPVDVPQGGQVTLTLLGANTHWDQAQTTAGPLPLCYGIGVPIVNAVLVTDATDAQLHITVPVDTPVGSYSFYVATGGEIAYCGFAAGEIVTGSINVYAHTPTLAMNPNNGLVLDASSDVLTVNFTGQFTHWDKTKTVVTMDGEGATLALGGMTPTSASGTLTIAAGAAPGLRLVTFTTGTEIVHTYFNVTKTPVGLLAVLPWHAGQGKTLNVQLIGLNTHWASSAPQVLFGPQITVDNASLHVSDNTHLSVDISTSYMNGSVSTLTPPGAYLVYVNDAVEEVIGNFTVDPPATPIIESVCIADLTPCVSSAQQGSTYTVTITGRGTHWTDQTEAILGAGIDVAFPPSQVTTGSVTLPDGTVTTEQSYTATIAVSPTAPLGSNGVVMITGSEVDTGSGFTVTGSAASLTVHPQFSCSTDGATPPANGEENNPVNCSSTFGIMVVAQLQTAKLHIEATGTHWLQGETVANWVASDGTLNTGIHVDNLTITSPTTADVQFTVLSSSPLGLTSLSMITDGEVVTLDNAIDVEAGVAKLLAFSPGGAQQGATLTLQLLGRLTHWDAAPPVVTFSSGVQVNSVNVIDSETMTANITVSPWATWDCGHSMTVTVGTEQVSSDPNVTGNFCVALGAQQIASVSPLRGIQGSTEVLTITGSDTNFIAGVTTVDFGDPNFQVGQITVTGPTTLSVPVGISTAATTGFKLVTVQTYGQIASKQFSFTVTPGVGILTEANPYQAQQGQQNLDVILTGQYTHFSSLTTADFGAGVVVNSVTYNSPTEVTANINIDPIAYPGGRKVTVTTTSVPCEVLVNDQGTNCPPGATTGVGSEIVSANVFTVIRGPAIITNVAPNTGNQGQEVVFTVTGSATHWQQNFTQFYMQGVGSDVTVNSVVFDSMTSATVDVTLAPTATPGPRSIYMMTAGESLVDSGAFVVTGGIPAIAYLSPNHATQGTNQLQVTLYGLYTHWDASSTVNFGPGVTVTSLQLGDSTHIEAIVDVDAAAQTGYRTVVVQTGAQQLTSSFLVKAPAPPPTPYVNYIWPNTGLTGQTLTINFSGMYTHWDPGPVNPETQVTFGDGIFMNWGQVLSPNSYIANISIAEDATPGQRLFVFSTGNNPSTAETESVGFNVVSSTPGPGAPQSVTPILSIVDPGSGMQGAQDLTVNIIGQYTAFDSTTTFGFGGGIIVNGPPTILGETIAQQSITIPQTLATGWYAVTAITPGAALPVQQMVGGASFYVTPSLATITSVMANTAKQGDSIDVSVTGLNTHWAGGTTFQVGSGIAVSNLHLLDATHATMTLTLPALAPLGGTWISAQTGGEVATMNNAFVVQAGTPLLLNSGPGSLPQQSSATFTILSQATNWTAANPPAVSYGAGVLVTNVNVTSPTSMTVTGAIDPLAYTGWRNLTVQSGQQVLGLSNVLYVAAGPAVIDSVVPGTAGQGESLPVIITGINTHWVQGITTLNFPNTLVHSASVTDATHIAANITVSEYAPAGQLSISATTLGESASGPNVFLVTQTQPELLAVVRSSEIQGASDIVTLTSAFTHFDSATSVVNFGAGITVNSIQATAPNKIVANIFVTPTAALGWRNVSVATPVAGATEVVALNNAFQVTSGPAAISLLSLTSGQQNSSLTLQITGSQSHFCAPASGICPTPTVASFGGGIHVTGMTVLDELHASVNITIPASTAVGIYDVTLTTGGETAAMLGGFSVTAGTPVLSAIAPATGHQGTAHLSVALSGLFTNFVNGSSSASFGAGITVNSFTVSHATAAMADITITSAASLGSRTVTVTTGPESATIVGGFTVLPGTPALLSALPATGSAGSTLNVAITGAFTLFQQGFSSVSFGSGVTVNSVTVNSLTQLTANLSIEASAYTGSRDVTVTTNSQTVSLSGGFNVLPGLPVVRVINPNIGVPNSTVTVQITGQYTNWTNGLTTVSFGDGITVGSGTLGAAGPVTVNGANSLTATLNIDPGASYGPRDVLITTGTEVETVAGGYTVQPASISPPSLVSISPGGWSGGLPINGTIVAVFSQPMDRTTINDSTVLLYLTSNPNQGWIQTPGTVNVDATGRVVTFTPTANLAVNSSYYLRLTNGILDASGNGFSWYDTQLSTTSTANTTPATVVAFNPPALQTVGTNVPIQLAFNTDMNQTTQSGLTVTANGVPVAGSLSWNSAPYCSCGPGTELYFTPTAPLLPNTTYTVSYGAPLADLAGNALTPGSFSFNTGSGADTAYNYTYLDFSAGMENVPTNFAPTVTFSKPVNPLRINSGYFFLYNVDSGKYIKGKITLAPNGMSATFTPNALLLPNTYYNMHMGGWGTNDAAGNYLIGIDGYFTTGMGDNQTAPTATLLSPVAGSTMVPMNAHVVVQFSAPVEPANLAAAIQVVPAGGSPVAGSVSLASDQVTATFTPSSLLTANTQYSVQIGGYQDMVGNAGTPYSATFTTIDSVAPISVSTGFDAGGNLITTGNTPDAHWYYTTGGSSTPVQVVAPGNGGWYSGWLGNGPSSSWVSINPESVSGNTYRTYSTKVDLTGYDLSNLCLVGSMGVDDQGELAINGTPMMGIISNYGSLSTLNIPIPPAYLNAGQNELSLIWGWTDNSYEAFRLQGSIQTCGAVLNDGMSVTAVSPSSGASNVATNSTVTVTFNHPLNPASVNASTLPVMIGWNSGAGIAGSYQVSGNTVTFTPETPFPVNTTIYLGNCNGPTDLAGEAVPGCYWYQLTWFTTASTATPVSQPFQVKAFTPANGAINMGLRVPVVATFDRSFNPSTLNQSSAMLFNGDSTWCSSYSRSQDNATMRFSCAPLPASSTMTAVLNSYLQDYAGNGLAPFTSQFTTMMADQSGRGSIVSTRPGNGSSGVSANQPLVLFSNLPIDPGSATSGLQLAQNNVLLAGNVQVRDSGYTLLFTPNTALTPGALIQWWTNDNLIDATYGNSIYNNSGYFYVAGDLSAAAPSVQTISPYATYWWSGSPVPINSVVDVQFNLPLKSDTITDDTIYLYDNATGTHIPSTVTQPEPNVVRFVPLSPLTPNNWTFIYVNSGLQGANGVPANSGYWNFYTNATTDNSLPVVTSAVPFHGAQKIGVNEQPGVIVNKAIDPVSVNRDTFQVLDSGTPLVGSYWFSSDDTRIQFVPDAPLPASTQLTMTLNGVLDKVGHPLSYTSTFTTASGPDFTAPYLVTTSVDNNASIPANSALTVQFSESMDVSTFSNCNGIRILDGVTGNCIALNLSWNADQSEAYLVPQSPLAAGRTYYLDVWSGTDLAGNGLGWDRRNFYADLITAVTPTVINFNPTSGATGLGINALIEAQFSAPIDPTAIDAVTLTLGGATVPTTPVLSAGDTVLRLIPSTPLQPYTTYTMNVVDVKDPAGNAVAPASNSFTTGATYDLSAPALVNYNPPNGGSAGINVQPQLVFNKPLNPITVNNSNFQMRLSDTGQWIPLQVTIAADEKTVTLIPQIPLLPHTTYYVTAPSTPYQDQNGNNGSYFNFTFTTSGGVDSAAPTVSITPRNGATDIPTNAVVAVLSSEAIDPLSWSQSSIQLFDSTHNSVPGAVSQSNSTTLIFQLSPGTTFAAGTTYTVNVAGFTDTTGIAVASTASTFTTGVNAASGGLTVTGIEPLLGAANVANDHAIVLTFSQDLIPETVNSATLKVMNTWNSNRPIAGTYAVNGHTVTFTPLSKYPPGANITVGECGGPTDVLGEVFLSGGCYVQQLVNFTVSADTTTADTSALEVLSASPANGAFNVRHDQPVSVTFNKAINPYSVWSVSSYNAQLYAGQDPVLNGSFSVSADGLTLIFNNGALADGTIYTIVLPANGIADESGNALVDPFVSTFTTAVNPSANAGSVIAARPNWNATGVAANSVLALFTNRTVDPASLAGNVNVTVNGTLVSGTLQAEGDNTVQFTPSTPFPAGSLVQWFFSGVRDTAGVAFNGNSGVFYMAALPPDPATAQPTVVAVSPGCCGSNNVPTNAEIDIQYSQPIDPASIDGNVWQNAGPAASFTLSMPSANVVRINPPASGWNANTQYGFCSNSGVKGVNGVNAGYWCWGTYFTTGSAPDTASGTVKIGPPDGVVNVGSNAYIRLQFSKPANITSINASSVQMAANGMAIPGSWSWSWSGNDVYGANFTPDNPLPLLTPINVAVNSVLDYAGNAFTPATSQFTIGAGPDLSNPSVAMDFNWWTSGIATNASFTCRYSEPIDPSSVNAGNTYVYSYDVINDIVPVTYTWSSDLMSVTMKPTTALFANSRYYYACYGAIDLTGNSLNNNNAGFITGNGPSSAGPVLLQINPPNGMTNVAVNTSNGPWYGSSMQLQFNEPVATDSLGQITLAPENGSAIPIGVYSVYGDSIAAVQLPYTLRPNTKYAFNVKGVTDYDGNPMTPVTSTFTTGSKFDWSPPGVAAFAPSDGSTGVDVNPSISITFSEAMDPVLLTSNQVYLVETNTGNRIPTAISFSPDYTAVNLTPSSPLTPNTRYTIYVQVNNWWMTDIAGNSINTWQATATFTTGTPVPVDGVCGAANHGSFSAPPSTALLCSAGTASALTNSGLWNWNCDGQYGGVAATCSANVALTSTPVPQPSGLVSWWPGNDNADDIIGGNTATLQNGAGYAVGNVQDAFSFNGNNQFALVGQPVPANLQIQNAITLSAWIYPTAYPTDYGSGALGLIVGSQHDGDHGGASIFFDGRTNPDGMYGIPTGHIHFQIGDGSNWHSTNTQTQIPVNQWTLVTATRVAGGPPIVYYNGVAQPLVTNNWSDSSASWNGTIYYPPSTWFAIGQQSNNNRPFTGLIDEVQVYNAALTADQVQAIYSAGSAGMYAVQTPSTTTVSSSASPAQVGDPVTFTAYLSPSTATGTVTFMDGGVSLGSALLDGGQASISTAALTRGVHSITAIYSGDATYSGSVSSAITQIESLDGAMCAPQTAGLLDWYPAESNTVDIIGANHGSIEGSVSYAPGAVGQAFNFTSAGAVDLSLPSLNTAAGTQVTVSFWMNWSGSDNKMPFGFTSYDLWLQGGLFGFNTGNTDLWGISSAGLANTWVYVTAVFNNGDPHANKLFINGVPQTLSQQMGSTGNFAQVDTLAKIGSWNDNYGYQFNGQIDEVQIFNGALTAAQVQSIYQAGAAGVCALQAPTTTALSSSQNPVDFGASVTFTATVSPGDATGTVSFMDSDATLGTASLSGDQATLSTSALNVGAHNIFAVYDGDTTYAGSRSDLLTQWISSNYLGSCPGIPANAVAFWSFDETSGSTATDRFGVSPGAWMNDPTPVPGEVRQALSFDGNSYVSVPQSSLWDLAGNDFSIELWVNFASSPGGSVADPGAILVGSDEGGGTTNKWVFATGGDYLYFHINGPSIETQFLGMVPFSPVVGQWYHLAVTRAGSTYTLFINGVASGTAMDSTVIPTPDAPLTIGKAEGFGLNGIEDELTIYNRALTPEEIQGIYLAGSAGKCTNSGGAAL